MSLVDTERVLVVPTARFRELGYFQGFSAAAEDLLQALLDPAFISYRPRSVMERDPSYKQLIPYVLFRHIDAQGETLLFQYTRGTGQGEQRLHRKRSVGVGGHISSTDAEQIDADAYRTGMQRELEEEVHIGAACQERCVGLINDDETEVGRVHLGVVHLFDVAQPLVEPREKDIVDSGFRPVGQLLAEPEALESWSRICLEALFGEPS